jgi:meso-butanediol dehydrogenase/(S,S)-butanediol dehydrogenase/diacetyl reductase
LVNQPRGSAWKERVAGVPMGRAQTAQDVADMASFLASRDSDFITGQSYHVDGGVMML